jgi:hypothetical protein
MLKMFMKSRTAPFILQLIVLCFMLVACSSSVEESSAPVNFDDKHINQEIVLVAPGYSNTFKSTDAISVEITNTSSYDVGFQNNFSIRLFLKSNNEWTEVAEVPTTRLPEGDVLLSPKATKTTYIMPDLPRDADTYSLRIYVFGATKGNKEFAVAAFTDLKLNP